MADSSSVWRRFWSHFDWLDSIDVLIYGGFGLALLGFTIYCVAVALFAAGHTAALIAFVALIASSAAALVRDLRRRQLSTLSRCIAGAWALCTAFVILLELIESFS